MYPGEDKPENIRTTHFSRNPKIATFPKVYHYVKEFDEGIERICREQEANGAQAPSFRTDDFILKITVPKVTENSSVRLVTEQKRTEKLPENTQGLTEKLPENVIENVTGSITDTSQKIRRIAHFAG